MRKKSAEKRKVAEVRRWFKESVTYEGEPYVMDAEQVAAVICDNLNTIVTARAGSGKTRTIVAKIVYLIAKCGVRPDEIIAFVFNANAAVEINARLDKMRVDGVPVMDKSNEVDSADNTKMAKPAKVAERVKIATTFHAFARGIVYDICDGGSKCKEILADEKADYVLAIVIRMMWEEKWRNKIIQFVKGGENGEEIGLTGERNKVTTSKNGLSDKELVRFAKNMATFVDRAQQRYLGGEKTLKECALEYLKCKKLCKRERLFVKLGVECYRRYHWYLLDGRGMLRGFERYGTDFNLIVSWASKLICSERGTVREILAGKRYILIDEYQDFSQLFLAAVMAVRKVAKEAKLFVVGDDWQAINRFAGSEVKYFKEFEKYFAEDVCRLEIATNYRCDMIVVDTSRKFMKKAMAEKSDFRASSRRMGKVVLVNPRGVEVDFLLRFEDMMCWRATRWMVRRTPEMETVMYLKTLVNVIRKNRKMGEILILHRNNETNIDGLSLTRLSAGLKRVLAQLGIMDVGEYDTKVRVMTMHKSKGLEAEVVIILEADNGVIPKVHPDAELYGLFGENDEVVLDDQKRLFYVAMTRAKRRLYIIHDDANGVGFVSYLGRGMERWEE